MTERQKPELAVSAAIFKDGRVLLVRRAQAPAKDVWTLPGGRVEVGETLVECVTREIAEENTRLDRRIAHYLTGLNKSDAGEPDEAPSATAAARRIRSRSTGRCRCGAPRTASCS